MTTALQFEPPSIVVTRLDDSKKQSSSFVFLISSGSPVKEDSFALTVIFPSKIMQSAGILSPACYYITITDYILYNTQIKELTCSTKISPIQMYFGFILSTLPLRRTDASSSFAVDFSNAWNCNCLE